jgi:hypothetical protein
VRWYWAANPLPVRPVAAIHPFRKNFDAKKMDPRVKPAGDAAGRARAGLNRPGHVEFHYQFPVLGIEAHGSFDGNGLPFCRSSMECLSGERTNAMTPSRGGRLMVTPAFSRRSHRA